MANIPDDMASIRAIILAQSEKRAHLEALVVALRETTFGRKSEKSDPNQFELALEDIEARIALIEVEGEANELVLLADQAQSGVGTG